MAQSTSSTGNQPLIELRHVDKHYGDLHVLNDINLSVDRGEVVVVIGPSGSGKSTMCRTINRLETIDSPCRKKARILPACVPSWAWCSNSSTCLHI